jgi:hypothetical protein
LYNSNDTMNPRKRSQRILVSVVATGCLHSVGLRRPLGMDGCGRS